MTTIQVRNVPTAVSEALKSKARHEGRSLSDYLLRELTRLAQQPSRAEVLERIASRPQRDLPPAADMLAAERPTA